MASVTLAISAVTVRLAWEVISAPSVGHLAVVILSMLVTLGIYALLLYLAIKPSLKTLKSLPVRIGVTVLVTAAIIDALIHFIRFVPSPEAASPLSVVIATLLIMAGIIAYPLVLWVTWFIGKGRIV